MTVLPPPPPALQELLYGTKLRAGRGQSVVIADLDFETYSEAGFKWDSALNKFVHPYNPGSKETKGLPLTGTAAYAQHPSTEVLTMAYDLKDGKGPRVWSPVLPSKWPQDLFDHLARGGLIEAWNCSFERWIWESVCVVKYGFPPLPFDQLRDAKAKAMAHCLPPSLEKSGEALNISLKKLESGKRLIQKFSIPKNPTKRNHETRNHISYSDLDTLELIAYNVRDIVAEAELSSRIPDLSETELELWLYDQRINRRGVQVDMDAVNSCIKIIKKARSQLTQELQHITNGELKKPTEVAAILAWLSRNGLTLPDMQEETITNILKKPLPPILKRVIEIRSLASSAAVSKLFALRNRVGQDGRLNDVFSFHGARTGRYSAQGVQLQNFPNSGPTMYLCSCDPDNARMYGTQCGMCESGLKPLEWGQRGVDAALRDISTGQLKIVTENWKDAIAVTSGCLRGLLVSKPGHDLICSDYSAIEAVVLAALAGETWRLDVFKTHGKIYEQSASKITGIPFEEYLKHKNLTGQHHPTRKTIGKVAELASGYGGGVGAWKQFGADEFFSDDVIQQHVYSWRNASPNIVALWGGQDKRKGLHGLEGCAIQAVLNPGKEFEYKGIKYLVSQDILYCELLSGRYITYHKPRAPYQQNKWGRWGYQLSFEGWNTNPKNGPIHKWIRMQTFGGRLTENVVQATARDILTHAIVNLEKQGYPVVIHVHDEIVSEVKEGEGSIEEFEKIMATYPEWAKDWPLKAAGGWRGKRYGK